MMVQTKRVFTIHDNSSFLKQIIVSEFDDFNNEIIRLLYNSNKELMLIIKKEFSNWHALLCSSTFDCNGKLKSKVIYEYDHNRNLIGKKFLNNKKQLISRLVWKFDEHNNLIEYKKYGLGESLIERKEYEYHSKGRLSIEKLYNKNRELIRLKRFFYDENDFEIEEKIFNHLNNLMAQKIVKYNNLKLPELILWFAGSGKMQRTEEYEYHQNKNIKREVVNDFFGNQYFKKKYDTEGKLLEAYHLKKEYLENLEIIKYDQRGKKLLQEKYSLKNLKKQLKQQIIYEYDDKKQNIIQKNNFFC